MMFVLFKNLHIFFMANSALQLTRGTAMADILMVIGVLMPDLVHGPAPLDLIEAGAGLGSCGFMVFKRERQLALTSIQSQEEFSFSYKPDIADIVCSYVILFFLFLSEFYQTGQLSFMTQADSLTLETNCRENVFSII